jgi:pimeloyl-ACP methyl ester carboxylesterase
MSFFQSVSHSLAQSTPQRMETQPLGASEAGQKQTTEALWINVSPSLSPFDQPLLRHLSRRQPIAQWSYEQGPDESCSLEIPLTLLHDYLKRRSRPVHLLGHGLSGAIALLYARRHPARVRSLTLLAVAEQPAVTWQAHYYVQRYLLPCSAERLLARLAKSLFRRSAELCPGPILLRRLVQTLQQDLITAPLLHSACHIEPLPQGGVQVPLLLCGAQQDCVVHPEALNDWSRWLKPGDRSWLCPEGSHFFHYTQAEVVAKQVAGFWRSLPLHGDASPSQPMPPSSTP